MTCAIRASLSDGVCADTRHEAREDLVSAHRIFCVHIPDTRRGIRGKEGITVQEPPSHGEGASLLPPERRASSWLSS